MPQSPLELPSPAVAVTIRVTALDGTVQEYAWQDGEVVTRQFDACGALVRRSAVSMWPNGDVAVEATETPGGLTIPNGARMIRVAAADVDHRDVIDGLRIDKTFDHGGRLSGVHLQGPWGEETLTLQPDGTSTRTWRLTGVHGEQTWDAAHRCTDYEVAFGEALPV
jgi:hypothetical protein